jgi:predicted AAA+ superfamily ATPase
MEDVMLELSGSWPAILITGPRQSGKTTMLKSLSAKENADREYVSLDDLDLRYMAKNDPKMFLRFHKPPVLIDEVQYAPEFFTYVKMHIDENHRPGGFWVIGNHLYISSHLLSINPKV